MSNPAPSTAQSILRSISGDRATLLPIEALTDIVDELQSMIVACLGEALTQITIDLSRQRLLNSAALEALLDAADMVRERQGSLRLTNVSALLREVLHVTGLDGRLTVADAGGEEGATGGRQRLGDILIARGVLTDDQLQEALRLQKQTSARLGEILIKQGWATDQDILQALSNQLSVPESTVRPGLFDADLTNIVDRRTLTRLKVLPMFRVRKELTLATANPQHMPTLREIEHLTGCRVRAVLSPLAAISSMLDESSGSIELGTEFLAEVDEDFEVVDEAIQDLDVTGDLADGSPIINLVNSLIQRAVREGASDIHIEPSRDTCRVRFRIDGVLYQVMTLRPEVLPAVVSRVKVMANLDIAERRLPQDGRVQVMTQGRSVDLRFSSLPGLFGEKVVLRVLDKSKAMLDLDRLGMSAVNLGVYRKLMNSPHGLILVTGPTGSGKTTSLYAALNNLNSIEKNLVTIEDPVEYQIDVINQNEVRNNIGLSFAKILKHVLRQDPDVVMVGEIRERETAEIAVQAALTGHLVLSTLHTNDSISAVTRMIDMGVEPYLLSSALIGVVAQRLIRTVCSSCKTQFLAPRDMRERYGWPLEGTLELARGRGCQDCYDSGYRGRAAIHESFETDEALQRLIMSNPSRDELTAYVRDRQLPSLFDDGLLRVLDGVTTLEEISRVVNA
ncbi:MAG: ATPase, T2SS/T4P/T4SS family [Pseudomonadota bacterium]